MTFPPFAWRPATPADVPALAALYRESAEQLGPLVYTLEQTIDAHRRMAANEATGKLVVLPR